MNVVQYIPSGLMTMVLSYNFNLATDLVTHTMRDYKYFWGIRCISGGPATFMVSNSMDQGDLVDTSITGLTSLQSVNAMANIRFSSSTAQAFFFPTPLWGKVFTVGNNNTGAMILQIFYSSSES